MAMMYMYSSGLPLVPYFPVIPSSACAPAQYTGQTSYHHHHHQPPSTIRRDELLLNGYKDLKCPIGILTDPPPPVDGAADPGTDGGTGERATQVAAGGCSLSAAKTGEAGCRRSPLVRDKNQLKFGIDRILGNLVSSATERTDRKAATETYEAADRDRTNMGVFETTRHDELTAQAIGCNGWRSSRVGDHSPGYTGRSSTDELARIEVQLPRKFSSLGDYCRGCYQDNASLVHSTCDPWSYAQYAYRVDHSHPYSITEPHHPPHHRLVQQPHTTPNARLVGRRKRSWSRAVFTSLQRKGLEKRFELQKYVNKPDRRQLAAALGLTDAQVKVWFQNRRMKWRHLQRMQKQQRQAADTSSPGAGTRLTDDCSGTDEEDPTEKRSVLPVDGDKDALVGGRDRFTADMDNNRGPI